VYAQNPVFRLAVQAAHALRRLVPTAFGMAVPLAVLAVLGPAPAAALASSRLAAGDPVPALRMQDLDGDAVSLADLRGHPVIVNVWATWCGPCRREIPTLNRVHREFRGRGLRVVGVDLREATDRVERFRRDVAMDYPVWVDPPGHSPSSRLLEQAGSHGLPTTLFIDADGTVQAVSVGELDSATLREGLGKILSQQRGALSA